MRSLKFTISIKLNSSCQLIDNICVILVNVIEYMILLSVWSALNGSQKGGGCHEANDHGRGNGCALSGRFYSCTDQGFGCERCAVVPV